MSSALTFFLAEASLELVPQELLSHPSVAKHALRLNRRPALTLLDRSFHHKAMLGLNEAHKRGRPDIVHFALLEVTASPLYMSGALQVYVHTFSNMVIELGPKIRLPKSYHRFEGLMVKLLTEGRLLGPDNNLLMKVQDVTLEDLLQKSKFREVIGLSRHGEPSSYYEVANILIDNRPTAFVVGGFPKGRFSSKLSKCFTRLLAIDTLPLEAHVVICRLIHELEKAMDKAGVPWRS